MFRFIKKTAKVLIIVYLVLLVFRPSTAGRIIDCDISDGSISVVGSEIPVDASEILEAYSGIERRASALIPSEVSRILSEVSAWLEGLFASGEEN